MIRYQRRRRYKYTLTSAYTHPTDLLPSQAIERRYLQLDADGLLTIQPGYAWDGPSGPTLDTPSFMRGSLVHDALYQLMREGDLPIEARQRADALLRDICLAAGMWPPRARYVHWFVRRFGARHAGDQTRRAP